MTLADKIEKYILLIQITLGFFAAVASNVAFQYMLDIGLMSGAPSGVGYGIMAIVIYTILFEVVTDILVYIAERYSPQVDEAEDDDYK